MSMELHAIVGQGLLPDRSRWQTALESLGLPVELYPDLDLSQDSGFSPCKLKGKDSGFEVYVDSPDDLAATYPALRSTLVGSRHVISFRWGADTQECACVLAAAAALVHEFGAIVYDPQADENIDLDHILEEFRLAIEDLSL